MGDAGCKTSYGGQTVTHADFIFKTAKFCAVLKGIDVTDGPLLWNDERGDVHGKSLFLAGWREPADFTLRGRGIQVGQLVDKKISDWAPIDRGRGALQHFLSGSVHQRDAAFKIGGDQGAADGVDHVFMQRLKAEKLAALVAQLHAGLAQLGGQSAGEVRHSKVG